MNSQTVENRTSQVRATDWVKKVTIRPATAMDLPGMEWDGEFAHFRRLYADAYQREVNGTALLWVAELNGKGIIGQAFVQYVCDRPELADGWTRAYLYSFRIMEQYQRAGLGSRIMQVIENDLIQRNYRSVTLNVAKTNVDAQRLYFRLGYRIVAHEPGVWSYPDQYGAWHRVEEPAWRMEKKLGKTKNS
jgi:ribosomal protein S18 acetylase RimI-like enzyme